MAAAQDCPSWAGCLQAAGLNNSERDRLKALAQESIRAYRARKTQMQLNCEQIRSAHCTVRRLVRGLGLRGAMRARPFKITIVCRSECNAAGGFVEGQFVARCP